MESEEPWRLRWRLGRRLCRRLTADTRNGERMRMNARRESARGRRMTEICFFFDLTETALPLFGLEELLPFRIDTGAAPADGRWALD